MKDTKPLGEYFRKFRKDKGLFQVELAKKIGVNEMSIMSWEKGKTKPHKKYIEGLNGGNPGDCGVPRCGSGLNSLCDGGYGY